MRLRLDAVLSGILLCVVLGGGAASRVPAADAAESSDGAANPAPIGALPSRDEIRAAAEKLRGDPNLGGKRQLKSLHWTGRPTPSTPADAPTWLTGLFEFLGQSTGLLLWLLGAIAAAIAAVWVIRVARARLPADPPLPLPAVSRVLDMDVSPDSLPEDVGGAALALLEAGRTRAALSLLYRGALSRAVHRHGVPIGASYTEGEALRAVRAKLDPERADYFSDLIGIWQRAVYAGETVTAEPIERLCRGFLPTLDGSAA